MGDKLAITVFEQLEIYRDLYLKSSDNAERIYIASRMGELILMLQDRGEV